MVLSTAHGGHSTYMDNEVKVRNIECNINMISWQNGAGNFMMNTQGGKPVQTSLQ